MGDDLDFPGRLTWRNEPLGMTWQDRALLELDVELDVLSIRDLRNLSARMTMGNATPIPPEPLTERTWELAMMAVGSVRLPGIVAAMVRTQIEEYDESKLRVVDLSETRELRAARAMMLFRRRSHG